MYFQAMIIVSTKITDKPKETVNKYDCLLTWSKNSQAPDFLLEICAVFPSVIVLK